MRSQLTLHLCYLLIFLPPRPPRRPSPRSRPPRSTCRVVSTRAILQHNKHQTLHPHTTKQFRHNLNRSVNHKSWMFDECCRRFIALLETTAMFENNHPTFSKVEVREPSPSIGRGDSWSPPTLSSNIQIKKMKSKFMSAILISSCKV